MKDRKILMFVVAVSLFSGLLAMFFGLSGPTLALAAGGATNLPADEPAAGFQILSRQVRPESGSGLALPSGLSMGQPLLLSTPALTVTKVSEYLGGGSLQPGERISYTIAISNGSSTEATGVVVSDTFPANTDFVTDTIAIIPPSAGTPGTFFTQPVIASDLTVMADSWVTVTYAVTASTTAPDETEIVNTASVTSSQVATPTTATVADTVDVLPDITVQKDNDADGNGTFSDTEQAPNGGATVTFKVTVTNNTSEDATIVSIADDTHLDLSGSDCASRVGTILTATAAVTCTFVGTIANDDNLTETNTITVTVSDDDGNTAFGSDTSTVTTPDLLPFILVTKTPIPDHVPESGGNVNFDIRIKNWSSKDPVTIDVLTDTIYGDLEGQGCDLSQPIPPDGVYQCVFSAFVTGDHGQSEKNKVTAAGSDDDGNPVSHSAEAEVTFDDVLPTIDVTKTANPSTIEPGGSVNFTVRVENTSPVESLTLIALEDDPEGDLNGRGDCSVPQTISVGGDYECSYSATVNGVEGEIKTSEVTAEVSDDEGNETSAIGGTTVTIGPALPIYLPLISFPGLTVLSVRNNTSANIRVAVDGTSIVDCLVETEPNELECGSFPAGTYTFRVITSVCGPGTKVIAYSPGPALTTVSCP